MSVRKVLSGKVAVFAIIAAIALCLNSCVSVRKNVMGANEMAGLDVIGQVNTQYTSYQPVHLTSWADKTAYNKLLKAAQDKYCSGDINVNDIDVVNVQAKGAFSPWQIPLSITYIYLIGCVIGNIQSVDASADVIIKGAPADKTRTASRTPSAPSSSPKSARGLESAIQKACAVLIESLPKGSKIAVIDVVTKDNDAKSIAISEVEYNLVSTKNFLIVDRHTLDAIRKEQNFQMSGDVSDDSMVAIGALAGATVVITGEIVESGNKNRLSLKALDVKSGQIISMGRETY